MPYTYSKQQMQAYLADLLPVLEGKNVEWFVNPNDMSKFSYTIRDVIATAKLYADEFGLQDLVAAIKPYRLKIEGPGHIILRNATKSYSAKPIPRTTAAKAPDEPATKYPIAPTWDRIVGEWVKTKPSRITFYAPGFQDEDFEKLNTWAEKNGNLALVVTEETEQISGKTMAVVEIVTHAQLEAEGLDPEYLHWGSVQQVKDTPPTMPETERRSTPRVGGFGIFNRKFD